MFRGSFKVVSRMFQGNFRGDSNKIEGCVKVVLSGFQLYLKEVQRVFQGSFNSGSRKCQRRIKEVSKVF